MDLLWKVSSILFCLTLTKFGLISCVLYVENGTSLTLDPGMKGTPEDILWTFNGNKVAERDPSDFQEYGQFIKRTEIEFTTGRLRVHRMSRDDSGFYRVMIQINGKLQYYEEDVEVIDGVPEPQVTCELSSSSQSRRLLCSVTDEINVTYTWTGPDVLQSGQTLEIDEDKPSESLYICTVKNPVSQKSKSIILKDCSTEGLNLPLIIIIPLVSIGLIVGASALLYFKCWRNKQGTIPSYSGINQNEDENHRSRDDHYGDQNREQRVNEDKGTLKNEGAVMSSPDSDGNTNGNISEQNKDVQSESDQIDESDQNRVQQEHEGTLNNEGVNMINQETKSKTDENISEQKKEVQSESEQIDDSDQNRVQQEHEGTLNNEGVNMINQETKSKTDENISEQKKDVQSDQIDESDVNQISRDDHNGDQNRVQKKHEDEGPLKNDGAGVMIQETKSKTDENISEQKKEVQSEQIDESDVNQISRDDHNGDQNRVQKKHEDEGPLKNDGAGVMIQETKSKTDENISEQKKEVQSQQIDESDQSRVQREHEGTLNNEGVNMINQETKSKIDENISEQKKDVQSEQIHELDDHDGDQNREQRVHEDEGTLKNKGAVMRSQDSDGNTDENISEQNKEDVQFESEQKHESEYSKEAKEKELKMSSDRRESVDTNEHTDCINKDSQSENSSDEHSKHKDEGNNQSEHVHDSAHDCNQRINDDEDRKQITSENREDLTEERNTVKGAEENIPENSEDASTSSDSGEQKGVKDRVRDIENRALEHKS